MTLAVQTLNQVTVKFMLPSLAGTSRRSWPALMKEEQMKTPGTLPLRFNSDLLPAKLLAVVLLP